MAFLTAIPIASSIRVAKSRQHHHHQALRTPALKMRAPGHTTSSVIPSAIATTLHLTASFFNPFAKPSTPSQAVPRPPDPPAKTAPAPKSILQRGVDDVSSKNNPPLRLFDAPSTPRKPHDPAPSFVTQAVRSVGTSVVRIDTERLVRPSPSLDPLLDDPHLAKLFGEPSLRPRLERGQGSGFIISADGYLLTNAHVVRNAQKVTVTLTDGRVFAGVVKGSDEFLDLAVVKVDAEGRSLPVAPMGASADLEVGDWVIAVGNPVGLDNTVTLGIVSSLNRSSSEVGIPEKRLSLIQTSASLNPGSSGGPICNQWGEVVGISTAVRANAEAIGFAIPIDVAKDVAAELAKGKTIAHAFVGIKMANLTPAYARQNNKDPNSQGIVPEIDGALVMRVVPKSPAAEAGIRRNDVIVAIDGHQVRNAKDVQAIVDRSRVGQIVTMHVLRGDSSNPLQVGIKTGNLSLVKKDQFHIKPEVIIPRDPPTQ